MKSQDYSNGVAQGREDSRWMRERIAELEAERRELVGALTKIANAPSEMIWGEDYEVNEAMKKMESIADSALAKIDAPRT